jgi:hypothetical protein
VTEWWSNGVVESWSRGVMEWWSYPYRVVLVLVVVLVLEGTCYPRCGVDFVDNA